MIIVVVKIISMVAMIEIVLTRNKDIKTTNKSNKMVTVIIAEVLLVLIGITTTVVTLHW